MKTVKSSWKTFLLLLGVTGACYAQDSPQLDVPYVPTSQEVVDAMLELAGVTENDVVYDLGCGDGRIVITAAKQYGATGKGIDIDPERISEAKANAREADVEDKVEFIQADLFESDFSEASVVTLYLLSTINMKLRPILLKQLKPGTRIVSHAFDMGDWEPDETRTVNGTRIYLWTVPEQ
ncbi:methyltransferase family protein [Anseongella ginsenosidimutans]|uniref:Methyltransferase family protein n=1 Tax=Anseongella ginsenosidimutans TaxID=496056 RepID=A0A4V2UTY4_9SPHI|nr:class I SAM-dependent methyltransferase [Anseongella ginsenosidimutans]QEC53392.1 class I SAM-dependent methyltransferase [Anseongella ginsenosidimutans]TCS88282.1 methyltransferase family protein [Anseongella ginsenosidimutans]